jgi:HAD superfamily hydrolase (TIGR01662 family)
MTTREILLILGPPGSGKTTVANDYTSKGYLRLNRDTLGGKLEALVPKLEELILTKSNSVVLDNTYPTKASRAGIIALGVKHGIPVRALLMSTTLEEAQYNVSQRLIAKFGKLPSSEDIKHSKDPGVFPATVLFHYRKIFEAPAISEGFHSVETYQFTRIPSTSTGKGVIFDYDGTLRYSKSGAKYPVTKEDIGILPGRKEELRRLINQGYTLCGVSNQSGVSKGLLTYDHTAELFKHTNQLLGLSPTEIDTHFCPHSPMPLNCYCRKPMPGLGVQLLLKHGLNPANTVMVGDMKTDESFSNRVGVKFIHETKYFANPSSFCP